MWADLPSPHITPELMFRLAQDVDQALQAPETLGAVIIHGTDVLVESAFMADLVLHTPQAGHLYRLDALFQRIRL